MKVKNVIITTLAAAIMIAAPVANHCENYCASIQKVYNRNVKLITM